MPILIQNRRRAPRVGTPFVQNVARIICRGLALVRPELSIVLTDDATIQTLNKQWRGKDKATDVLSFPQHAGVLGDVVISMDTAARQALALRHSLEAEVQRLLVHGVLHLLGHDHVHGGLQARRMKQEEQRLMRLLKKSAPC